MAIESAKEFVDRVQNECAETTGIPWKHLRAMAPDDIANLRIAAWGRVEAKWLRIQKKRDAAIRDSERQIIVARLRVMASTIEVPPASLVERFGSNTGKIKAAMLEAIKDVIETCADQIALTSEAAK